MKRRLMDIDGFDTDEFMLEVQMGRIPGVSYIWKFGYSGTNTANVPNTIYDHNAGLYPYNLGYGVDAKAVDLVSTIPLSDDGILIAIQGLDADGYEQSETMVIGGTSLNTYSRVFRMFNANGTAISGEVDLNVTGTVDLVAHLDVSTQATLMAVYTIPKGCVGYMNKGITSVGSGKEAIVDYMVRPLNGIFSVGERIAIYQAAVEATRPYLPIPELADIEVRCTPTQNNTAISASFGLMLVDKDLFGL